ncbi:DUF4190 domain-containing protein [Geodermatophilus sp. SYSU D00815]
MSEQNGRHEDEPERPEDGVPPFQPQPSWGAPPPGFVPPPGPVPPQPTPYGYGAPYPAPGYPVYAPPQPANGVGIAGFVTGLTGLVLCWIPVLGFLLAGTGIVLSAVGMNQGKRTGASNGLAIAGLVCGIIGAIPGLIFLVAFLSVGTS